MKIIVKPMSHLRLGASSAHRWMPCPASLIAPDNGDDSEYAQKGRVAHEVAYQCLRLGREPFGWVGVVAEGDDCDGIVFTQELAENVKEYVDYVRQLYWNKDLVPDDRLEQKVALTVPDDSDKWGGPAVTGGTVDFHMWQEDEFGNNVLHIVDYKSGSIPQNPEFNEQLMIYALGVIVRDQESPTQVVLHIVQPKADGVRVWECPVDKLKEFWERLKHAGPRAQWVLAAEGIGEVPEQHHKEGTWCRWCPRKGICPLKTKKALQIVHVRDAAVNGIDMTDQQLREVLYHASDIRSFLKEAEAHARKTLEAGGSVPGFELAPGKRKKVWNVDGERIRSYLAERGISLGTPTPAAALKLVKDLPEDFWRWESGGRPRLVKIQSEFSD